MLAAETTNQNSQLSADAIREKARDVLSRADYRLDEGLGQESQALWMTVLTWLLKPFIWLFESLHGLPMPLRVLVVILLVVILVALIIHMVWSILVAIRGKKPDGLNRLKSRTRQIDPREVERAAERAAADGRYLEAVRQLFRAVLLRIEQAEAKKLRLGITNRELLRRYQKSSIVDPLSSLIDIVDRKWYGKEDCGPGDYEVCRSKHASLCEILQRSRHAVSA